MDENDKNSSQEPKSDKKLQLDLSEALTQSSDDDDDIIELKDEVTLPPEIEEEEIDINRQLDEDLLADEPAAEKIIDLDALSDESDEQRDVISLADDLAFEEEDEDEAEIPPLVEEQPLRADDTNEVLEITEFDDIMSDDSNELPTLSEISDELEAEDEFLELIDIEEDDLSEGDITAEIDKESAHEEIEDEIIQFDGPGADVEDVELEDFINDSLGEEIRIDDELEGDLSSSLGIEAGSDINLTEKAPESEEFDFNMDSSEISEKIDHLETIFFDDTEEETELDEEDASETEEIEASVVDTPSETVNEKIQFSDADNIDAPDSGVDSINLTASPDQIEKTIERVIQQDFSEKIERMITEVIEKAVSKEIERLKNILLEDNSDDTS